MNPISFLENKDLLEFFHRHKTEMACMKNPRTFLSQLRDHNLLPNDSYQKMSRMRSKDKLKNALYDFLDSLEKHQPELIDKFWQAAFKEVTMQHYPTLRKLHCSLMQEMVCLANKSEKQAGKKGNEEEEETNTTPAKKKKRKVKESMCEEKKKKKRVATPLRRGRSSKVRMSTPLKKGEKNHIWNWPLYRTNLPVRCGAQKATLDRRKMAKGGKCILHKKRWLTPTEFEKAAGKEHCKSWKKTIQCMNTPLQQLLQEGHLIWPKSRHRTANARKSLFATSVVSIVDEDENDSEESDADAQPSTSGEQRSTEEQLDEQVEQEPEVLHDVSKAVFQVTCGTKSGALHKKRFASGTCGKCVRTETRWMTPVEFVEEALGQTDTAWRRDIQWEGKPIIDLIKAKILVIHSLMCECVQCKPDADELENQRNDDECWVCKSEGEHRLVECDECPRSFHQKCHLPHIKDAVCEEKDEWLCTFCVFKMSQEYLDRHEQSREEVMSCNMSQHLLKCQYLFLRLCASEPVVAPNSSPFSEEEEESFSAAHKEIRMLLNIIAQTLDGYHTVGEFVSGLELVFARCTSQNQDAALVTMGDRLKKMFDDDFKNIFFIV